MVTPLERSTAPTCGAAQAKGLARRVLPPTASWGCGGWPVCRPRTATSDGWRASPAATAGTTGAPSSIGLGSVAVYQSPRGRGAAYLARLRRPKRPPA